MLGLILIYFIGKSFYDLANRFKKNKWGFAILGVLSYYAGTLVIGVLFFVAMDLVGAMSLDYTNERLLGVAAVPFGLFACYLYHKYLTRKWMKEGHSLKSDILDDYVDHQF